MIQFFVPGRPVGQGSKRHVGGGRMVEAENLALWPAMVVVDRIHEDRRSGAWPPLATNGRVLAYEAAAHSLFGALLGTLVSPAEKASLPGAQARAEPR